MSQSSMTTQDSNESDDDEVDCPKCGLSINKHGLGSHKDSKRCKVHQDRNEIKRRGLVPLGNSKKIKEFLRQSEHPVETLRYKYNGQRSQRYRQMDTVQSRKYTTEEGKEEAKRHVFPSPSDNGIRIKVSERLDSGIWLCTISSDYYDSELLFVDVDTEEDVSRRRVAYVNQRNDVAFTTDGDRIGDVYTPEEARDGLNVNSYEIISRVV